MIPDSGGAGEWRGGLGFARDYRILTDDVRFSMRTDKHAIPPFGIDRGLAGGKGACIVNPGGSEETRLASRFGDFRLCKNDIIRVERPGGGGLGNPLSRPVDNVLDDVRQGYVSTDRARTDYGVVLDTAGGEPVIDEGKTRVLRGKS
jgi:N-methylhydantoinase B